MKNRDYLNEEILWKATNNPEYPYRAFHEGKQLLIRLNDFPAEHLYTLIADDEETVNFDDWASAWSRELKTSKANSAAKRAGLRTVGKAKIPSISTRKN